MDLRVALIVAAALLGMPALAQQANREYRDQNQHRRVDHDRHRHGERFGERHDERRPRYAEGVTKVGEPDPYEPKVGAPNPYATQGGTPNPYATQGGTPNPYATRGGDPARTGTGAQRR